MTARRDAKRGADREGSDDAGASLPARLGAHREASTPLRLDTRDSTELLRDLQERSAR